MLLGEKVKMEKSIFKVGCKMENTFHEKKMFSENCIFLVLHLVWISTYFYDEIHNGEAANMILTYIKVFIYEF